MQKWGETGDVVLKLSQPAGLDIIESSLGNDESALPVIAPVEQYEEFPLLKETERLLRIILFLRDAHPENINRSTELLSLKSGARLNNGMPAICADDQVGANFHFACWSLHAHAGDALLVECEIDHFMLHQQLETWEFFCSRRKEIEKIPLRHESDEF